jgi:hypothetical protein
MIKTLGTALILAATLAFGITDAQAHTAPKAYAAQVSVKRDCRGQRAKPARCHAAKHRSDATTDAVRQLAASATIDTPVLSQRASHTTTSLAIAASAPRSSR